MSMLSRRALVGTGLSVAALIAGGYAVWPRLDEYQEKIAQQRQLLSGDPPLNELVRLTTLAANGHNTQPWAFRLNGGTVSILPDSSRRTPVVDPDDHHLWVSLGCATENLVIAAAALGRAGQVAVSGGDEPQIDVTLAHAPAGQRELYQAIPLRQTTRSPYDGQPVSGADLALLEAAAREDGVALQLFTERADREAILELVVAGNSAQMGDPAWMQELVDWLRFSPVRAIATGDGLFSACSGNPVLPEWIGRRVFPMVFKTGSENDKYRAQVRSSEGIAVFMGDSPAPRHWIAVGRAFQRFALQATALGIRTAHLNQPVEVPAVRADFARWLGVPGARPDLVIRFGRAPALPMSLRRPLSDVLA